MVEKAPPIKPSQVFFGDSLMSGVLPKKKPNMYAIMSLQMIMDTGTNSLGQTKHPYKLQEQKLILVCFNCFMIIYTLHGM